MSFREGVSVNQIYALMKQRLRAKTEEQRERAEAAMREIWKPDLCLFWSCQKPARLHHALCETHYGQLQRGLIDECPNCGQSKATKYKVCAECYDKTQQRSPMAPAKQLDGPEHSQAWEKKGDATAEHFFVYILKLDRGKFYAGQTRELRERLSEHRDGQTQSTAGKNPQLVWFGMLPTREQAAAREVELKKLVDSNPREIRRMIISFRDSLALSRRLSRRSTATERRFVRC